MEWSSLWQILDKSSKMCVIGRDIETNELALYGSDNRQSPGCTAMLAKLQELDSIHRVLCVNSMASIVRTEAGLYEHFGGFLRPMSGGAIQRAMDSWRLSDISSVLHYEHYEDTGKYDDLRLDCRVIDEIPRNDPRFILLEDGSVYKLSKNAIIGQVHINKRQIKQPGNSV